MSNAVNIRHEAADVTAAIEDDLLAQVRDMQTRLTKFETRATRSLLGKLFGKSTMVALLLAVFLISGTAWAQYTAFGGGRESCGRWTEQKNAARDARVQFEQWLGGYLTAYSFWVEKGSGPVSNGDHVGALAWLDNYCQENPLKNTATAAEQLIYAIKAN